jgi:hypothetical protein
MSGLLPCLMQFTLFPMQFYVSNKTETHNAVTPFDCKNICLNNSYCGGFNYDAQHLQCFALMTKTFNLENLVENSAYGSGFYMKSYSQCFTESHAFYMTFFIIVGALLLIGVPVCCFSGTRRHRRFILFSRTASSSSTSSLINNHEPVPPPYRSTDASPISQNSNSDNNTSIQIPEN